MSPPVLRQLPAKRIRRKFKPSSQRFDELKEAEWQLPPSRGKRRIRRKHRGASAFTAGATSPRLSCPRSRNWSAHTRRQNAIASSRLVLTNFYVPTPAL